MPITLDGSNGITTPTYGGADTSEYLVPVTQFKNRIINGAMVIDQRNAGASITPANDAYTLDRWQVKTTQASKFTLQQNAGSVTPPAGFTNYLGVTSSSAYSVLSGDYFGIIQSIEGYNVADLNFGSANAKTVTLSFWVRSSLTGTFGGTIYNSAANRSYPYSYTISAANTWEQKSVTITGDTTGTWLTTNGVGLVVWFSLGAGSTYSGTAGSWSSTWYPSVTGATSVVGTNGATWYVTGVQLEIGSTATSFDYRPYGTELQLCQRYFVRFGQVASNTDVGMGLAFRDSASQAQVILQTPSTLRTAPSVTFNGTISSIGGGNQVTLTSPTSIVLSNPNVVRIKASQTGYVSLSPYFLYLASYTGDYIDLSAEL